MIREHDRVVLTGDLSENGLEAGDVGTVVQIHAGARRINVAVGNALALTGACGTAIVCGESQRAR
jgi:hypothetical protein